MLNFCQALTSVASGFNQWVYDERASNNLKSRNANSYCYYVVNVPLARLNSWVMQTPKIGLVKIVHDLDPLIH